jgi:DNA gyrase subunit A
MDTIFPEAYLLTVSEKGFGKLTSVGRYPLQRRGGTGVRAHRTSDKIGKIVTARLVGKDKGYLVMLSTAGNVECIPIEQISVQSRNGRGVHLMALAEGDSVVSITTVGSLAIKS